MPFREVTVGAAACAALFAGAIVGTAASGCDEPYVDTCAVTAHHVLVPPDALARARSLALASSRAGVTASWSFRDVADAGADGGDLPLVTGFELARIGEDGLLETRTLVPAPDELRRRRGGVVEEGVVAEDGAALVHWVETTARTDPNGRLDLSAATKLTYVVDGAPQGTIAPERATCDRCTLRIAVVALGTESLAFFLIEPALENVLVLPAPPPRFGAVRIRRDGTVVEEDVPWLALPASSPTDAGLGSSQPATVDLSARLDREGRIVVVAGGRAWRADADRGLRLVDGPLVLPEGNARIAWDPSGAASIVWLVSPFDEGRSQDAYESRDVFVGLVPNGARAFAKRERVSPGSEMLAADRRGADVGMVFRADSRAFFAAVTPDGRKLGADVALHSPRPATSSTPSAATVLSRPHALVARGDGRFTVIAFEANGLTSSEIRCAK